MEIKQSLKKMAYWMEMPQGLEGTYRRIIENLK